MRSAGATRLLMLETAERLFAEQGVEHVSLREIMVSAGQRNTSALQYHFGSREGLIEAILALRMTRIDARRLEMLRERREAGLTGNLRAVVEARVWPLAEELTTGSPFYVRFLAQANLSPQVDVARLIRGRYDKGLIESSQLVLGILGHLPKRLVQLRLVLSATQMVYALAEHAAAAPGASDAGFRAFVDNLIDVVAGGLSAPTAAPAAKTLEVPRDPRP